MLLTHFVLAAQIATTPKASYTVSLDPALGDRARVTIALSGLASTSGEIEFAMPERYAFTELPRAHVIDPWQVKGLGATDSEVSRTAPFRWSVPKGEATILLVKYEVPFDHRTLPQVDERDDYEFPYLAEDHAFVSCGALFAVPRLERLELSQVVFLIPADWDVHGPWGSGPVWKPRNVRELQDGVIALGKWHAVETSAGATRATVAFAPSEARLADTAAPLIEKIVTCESSIFGGAASPNYLFAFVPSRVRGFGGSAKRSSMVLSVGKQTPAETLSSSIAHLVAHEFFHTWPGAHYDGSDDLRFVHEGFTDYFAYQVTSRVGAASWDEFAATLAKKATSYGRAAKSSKLSLVAAGGPAFFESQDAYEQVYSGGLLIAALCEVALRKHEPATTLEAFLRELVNDPRWSPGGASPKVEDFVALLEKRAGPFAARVRELVTRSEPLDFSAELRELGVAVETKAAPASTDLPANFDGTKLRDLDPASALYELGLRAGDTVLEVNGVTPKTPAETYKAFAAPKDGRIRLRLKRGDQELSIDEPIPVRTELRLDPSPWRT